MEEDGRETTPTASTHRGGGGAGGNGGRSISVTSESAMSSHTNANSRSTNAKWGNACAQCAVAKAKCSRQSDAPPGTKCQRCERLGKDCTNQVHRPRKKRAVRPSSVTPSLIHLLYCSSPSHLTNTYPELIERLLSWNNGSMDWSTFSGHLGICEPTPSQIPPAFPLSRPGPPMIAPLT